MSTELRRIVTVVTGLLVGAHLSTGNDAVADETATASVPAAFMDLYRDFTGIHDGSQSTIAQQLGRALEKEEGDSAGALVLVVADGVFAYDGTSRKLMASANTRLNPNNGFFELTAISHIGPAVMYLSKMKELGDPRWTSSLDKLLVDIRRVRELNAAKTNHWLDRLRAPALTPHHARIRDLVDYACSLASNFLFEAKQGAPFDSLSVQNNFLEVNSQQHPISFNHVMVATFALVSLSNEYDFHQALVKAPIDWRRARVVVRMKIGSNFSGGLTTGTNGVVNALRLTAENLPPGRIIITPYAEERVGIGAATLPEETFTYYAQTVWQSLYSRPTIGGSVFTHVPTIYMPDRPTLPGDYGFTSADAIDQFVVRLKHTFADNRELLSNALTFWMAGELCAKGWDPARVDIPGLTAGMPANAKSYPTNSPAIPE